MCESSEKVEYYSFSRRFINEYVYFSIIAVEKLEIAFTCRFSTEEEMLSNSYYNKKNKLSVVDTIKKTLQAIKNSHEFRESYLSKARSIKLKRASLKEKLKNLDYVHQNKKLNITEKEERTVLNSEREQQKLTRVLEKRRESAKQKIAEKLVSIERIKLRLDQVH